MLKRHQKGTKNKIKTTKTPPKKKTLQNNSQKTCCVRKQK